VLCDGAFSSIGANKKVEEVCTQVPSVQVPSVQVPSVQVTLEQVPSGQVTDVSGEVVLGDVVLFVACAFVSKLLAFGVFPAEFGIEFALLTVVSGTVLFEVASFVVVLGTVLYGVFWFVVSVSVVFVVYVSFSGIGSAKSGVSRICMPMTPASVARKVK